MAETTNERRPRTPGGGASSFRVSAIGSRRAVPPVARTTVFRRLLDVAAARRAEALEQARERGWFDPRGVLVVSVLDGERPEILRALAVAVQVDSRGTIWHIGELSGNPVLVSSASIGRQPVVEAIRAGALRRGSANILMGTASLRPEEEDLLPAVEEARIGLETASGADAPARGIAPCPSGIHLLLSKSDDVSPGVLRRASPGAFALWDACDPVQLETVEVYLDSGARVSEACGRLHVHRTTLYYRLENLPLLVREEPDDGLRRSVLHVVLKLLRRRGAMRVLRGG